MDHRSEVQDFLTSRRAKITPDEVGLVTYGEKGDPFDPNQHEAIMQQDSIYKVPTVVQLLSKGYMLHDRVLRPAQVAVSRGR